MMFWFLLFTTDKNKYKYRQRKNWDSKCSKSIEKIKSMKQGNNKRTANKKEKKNKKRLKESGRGWVLERLSVANFCWGANIPMASEDGSCITNNYKKKDICNVVGNVANIRQRNL